MQQARTWAWAMRSWFNSGNWTVWCICLGTTIVFQSNILNIPALSVLVAEYPHEHSYFSKSNSRSLKLLRKWHAWVRRPTYYSTHEKQTTLQTTRHIVVQTKQVSETTIRLRVLNTSGWVQLVSKTGCLSSLWAHRRISTSFMRSMPIASSKLPLPAPKDKSKDVLTRGPWSGSSANVSRPWCRGCVSRHTAQMVFQNVTSRNMKNGIRLETWFHLKKSSRCSLHEKNLW